MRARKPVAKLGTWQPELKTLPHPAYSPDLAPSDYYLFPQFKKYLKGHHYDNDEEVIADVRRWLTACANYLYGVESVDLQESKAFLEQDRDGDEALGKKVLLEKSPDSNHDGGLVLFINNLCLKDFQTARKRGVDFKLCRMATSIVAEISSFRVNIKCISLPFIIRTGSTQLWPYISNIVWFIWAQRDVCESDCKCPKELPLSSVLALIQARIVGAGLRLSNRALQRKMASGEKGLEVALPHKLTDGERMGWEEIIKQKCGIESNREPVVLKQNFIKQSNDCCLWAQVCGAVYTGLRLKKYDLDRFFHIGISHEMCESLSCVEQGEFLLRSSHNRRKQASGREPLAGVVIEMYLKEKVHPRVYLVEHFEKWTLKEIISHIKFEGEKHGSNIVRRILPSREDIQSLHEEPRQVFDENQYKRQHTGSAVPDQKELPPVIVISNQFQNLSLNPGTPRNFAGQSPLWPSPDDGKHKETIPPIMEDAEMHEEGARLPVTEMGIDSGEEKLLGAEGFVECQTDAASSSTTALDEDIENMELLPQETLDFLYSSTSHEMEIQSTLLQSMSSEHNQEDQLT
ncbi:histone-lysine N-methyltransferase SETMAR [Plakobranchus ocellatus]|uniref:Histone-lysine N-methyltransferase SETMAR n=1 Tax=Plakobranchus ocellatus TaxID=259542 RepID=A0AAV4BRV3_9GAST|nr:histone-lysine N-methyltransferase SETMAR [Plakobranchus ocellatus]